MEAFGAPPLRYVGWSPVFTVGVPRVYRGARVGCRFSEVLAVIGPGDLAHGAGRLAPPVHGAVSRRNMSCPARIGELPSL